MKLLRYRVFYVILVALVALGLTGCLTSKNPFYEEKDIVQDSKIIGTFLSEQSGLTVTVDTNSASGKRYSISLAEGGKKSDYEASLFKLDNSLFVDLFPMDEKPVAEEYKQGIPTASGLLRYLSHDGKIRASKRLHVIFRLELSDKGIKCFGAKKADDPSNPVLKDNAIKFHINEDNQEGIVLEEITQNLQSIVERYAGKDGGRLFQANGLELIRKF